jgi:hypothetical protein
LTFPSVLWSSRRLRAPARGLLTQLAEQVAERAHVGRRALPPRLVCATQQDVEDASGVEHAGSSARPVSLPDN